ncbi:CLIP domain-containing serine protease B8-like [Culex pipiens pallens]|uniref:CLIP domain-containing serine protease B8-like n=1 Tax=Culex pipiens pallens TaxID=42434 RepID=UPI0019540900|nr:CLIP domain-containing serine protease B8-like [Culex pipiens pallens]
MWLRRLKILVLVVGAWAQQDQEVFCSIPDQIDDGVCVDPSDCARLDASFYSAMQCGENRICCDRRTNHRTSQQLYSDDDFGCGTVSYAGKIHGGAIAGIDEFPWAALLLYRDDVPRCGGVLISRSYVISAAHCLAGPGYNRHGPLKFVRLREYDLNNDIDCLISEDEYEDCSEEKLDVPPQRIVVHPDYEANSIQQHHDIALIEIQLTEAYSDFLSPICLPTSWKNAGHQLGKMLTVTGWGRTDHFQSLFGEISSPIKMKASLPFVGRIRCAKAYSLQELELIPGQICAGGRRDKDSCAGDSGSPLMFFDRRASVWKLSGIVSRGPSVCGKSDLPGIYTNVVKYLRWIREITGCDSSGC